MALTGKGAIIIWNDIAIEGRDEFYNWHLDEHIPERVAIPGFVRGSRFIALNADSTKPEFLTVYEIADSSIATSAPYLARLNAPTDWTRRATAHFRNTQRALTEVVCSAGAGQGGVVGTIRIDGSEAGEANLARLRASTDLLASAASLPRVTGVHLFATNAAASASKTAESRDRADILAAPIGALLIEGCDAATINATMNQLLLDLHLDPDGLQSGLYVLEHCRNG